MDLHSGYFVGGAAANPIRVLAKILADLHDEDGRRHPAGLLRRRLPDLPDDVRRVWERASLLAGRIPRLRRPVGSRRRKGPLGAGADVVAPDAPRSTASRAATPGGFKTVIAAEAHAMPRSRSLVFDQDPAKIRESFRAFVAERLPADCTAEFHEHTAARRRSSSPSIRPSSRRPAKRCRTSGRSRP